MRCFHTWAGSVPFWRWLVEPLHTSPGLLAPGGTQQPPRAIKLPAGEKAGAMRSALAPLLLCSHGRRTARTHPCRRGENGPAATGSRASLFKISELFYPPGQKEKRAPAKGCWLLFILIFLFWRRRSPNLRCLAPLVAAPRVVMRRRPGRAAPSGLRFSARPEPRSETRLQIADICI